MISSPELNDEKFRSPNSLIFLTNHNKQSYISFIKSIIFVNEFRPRDENFVMTSHIQEKLFKLHNFHTTQG